MHMVVGYVMVLMVVLIWYWYYLMVVVVMQYINVIGIYDVDIVMLVLLVL